MDWDRLRVFHEVANAGSLTHAGEHLGLSQSAVSRQISTLEDSLGTPLFHRHARGLVLTEQGELLYQTVHEVFAKLAMTESLITESRTRPSGELRVTTTVAFGSLWLVPRIHEFTELYPEISLNLILSDQLLDLGMRDADCAIRLEWPQQPDLIQSRIITFSNHIYAAPSYVERHGKPETPEDLDNHKLIAFGTASKPPVPDINWLLKLGVTGKSPRQPLLQINNVFGMYRAALAGIGIVTLPEYMAETRNLVRLLPDHASRPIDAYFVYSSELRRSKRVAVFRDFLVSKLTEARV
ncbi:MAG: LysR family transcriptional regulator [Alphaproteobacteria bacterium]